jgi:hypothetical protein
MDFLNVIKLKLFAKLFEKLFANLHLSLFSSIIKTLIIHESLAFPGILLNL